LVIIDFDFYIIFDIFAVRKYIGKYNVQSYEKI
jgi:hypothetical protein